MKLSVKTGIYAFVAFVFASAFFTLSVAYGMKLIDELEAPKCALLQHFSKETGRAIPESILQSSRTVRKHIAVMIAVLATVAGVGLARGFQELSKITYEK